MKGTPAGDVYFSFVSPYAWRAAVFLEGDCRLRWTPFWAPAAPEIRRRVEADAAQVVFTPMPFKKVLYGLHEMRGRTAREGGGMALPRDRNPDWDLPHLAFLEARRSGKGRDFLMRAYEARWIEGCDITRIEGLAPAWERAGLDPGILASLPQDPQLYDDAAEGLSRAYRNGVFGVPFFVGQQQSYWGIHRMSDFVLDLEPQTERTELVTSPGAKWPHPDTVPEPPPEVVEGIGMYDYDHPGGCG